ncbi:LOW QUALITY PROTEIN: neuronal acetylcholine receptor subunit alpha-9-II [Triplophysa dalaica]|uniref:LOW QUALITY PROTEIN: neuronal acetylcholine receptor subunit alpha-9-II n=1 Tax=Triplophysa dalaica TaxID=1582913 RepID=UPI0024E00668|nr:LOW QUALITY PROTEIN: neuronal acetylcholine receptor subunit alpha-9-II [Triplophysa dalaica]
MLMIISALLLIEVGQCAQGRFTQKFLNDLMKNYSSALRPVDDTDKTLNVTLQVTLSQIKDMDERNQVLIAYLWIRQTWNDAYLKWNKEDYCGLEVIRIPSSLVWRPDLVLYNKAVEDFSGPVDTNVVLRYTGEITWDAPAITKSSCVVDVSYFPFDSQQCNLTFGSWTYNGNQRSVVLLLMYMGVAQAADPAPFFHSGGHHHVEWECGGMPATRNVIMYGCCSDPYPDITYTLLLQRRRSFYIFNLLLPCFLISFLAPLGFYLPADSGEKVSLGVTVLLALTVFQVMVAESMPLIGPQTSLPYSAIGKYYIATIFIMNIHFCGADTKPVPHWAKVLVIDYMSKIFFVYEVGESCYSQCERTDSNAPPPCFPDDDKSPAVSLTCDRCCCRGRSGILSCGPKLIRNVEYISNCFREQRATSLKVAEWKKVAKVMDRFFMWIFFIMVFLLSILIIGKAPEVQE